LQLLDGLFGQTVLAQFGVHVVQTYLVQFVNGHEVEAISEAVDNAKANTGCPSVIILDTIKGKGWSKSENQAGSHSRGFTKEELAEALGELQAEMDAVEREA